MNTQPKRILIAEDNQIMADVVRFNLEKDGYQVTVTNNGKQAYQQLQNQSFDLLITDFQMPEMSGDELCRLINEEKEHPHMQIILCSAKGYELDRDKLKNELNVSRLVLKPFSPIQLKQIVAEILSLTPSTL